MMQFSLRSLLVAVIVLSNCITWTASRHHYTHNVSGHRSRHRRQGKGLYLMSSYVIPGGEGTGWGEWGETSPCSRTCGGGVASQKRICLQVSPDGQPQCTGGDTKYFSCQTQDCPPGSGDFRAEQCAYYNNATTYRGTRYKWIPYTKGPNPCELNCMPPTERFYYRHKEKVIDGTRCNDESFDVCVDGTCQPVGCDMMLGSNAREDKCRNCRGNGKNCYTANGVLDTQDLIQGYNDMMLIPEGSTTIIIKEVKPSNNYLALRAKNGTYYLNGDYHIDFPKNMMIAGALWYYERSQQGFDAPDKLRCLGPIHEPIYLSLLLQSENVGIEYEYSLPSELAPKPVQKYNWVHGDFTPCSATCGGGFQNRNVTCRTEMDLEVVDEALCDIGLRPATNQSCNPQACPPQWVTGEWEPCSKRCGEGGIQSRDIRCEKIIVNGFPSIVSDKECFDLLGPKPEKFQECNVNTTCPKWFTEPWKPCDTLYGQGKQARKVICYQKNGGHIDVLEDSECADEKPETERTCVVHPDRRTDWVLSEWIGCDTCLSTVRTRVAKCTLYERERVDDSFCSHHPAPELQQPCDPATLPPCDVQWYATQWGKCSTKCGNGTQTRRVFCGIYINETVVEVDDSRCGNLTKYKDSRPCTVPKELCPSQWYASRWTKCSAKCGEGVQSRQVMCMRGDEPAKDCSGEDAPESTQSCDSGPCNEDEIIPVEPNMPPIIDLEDCEEEDYAEVGLDIQLPIEGAGTTRGDMLSDSPASDLGSGMTPLTDIYTDTSLAMEEFISTEGSGSGSSSSWFTDTTDDFSTTESTDLTTDTPIIEETVVSKKEFSTDSAKKTTNKANIDEATNTTGSTVVDSSTEKILELSTDSSSTAEYYTDDASTTESELYTDETETTDSSVESTKTTSSEGSTESESTGSTVSSDTSETPDTTESTVVEASSTSTDLKSSSEPSGPTEVTESTATDSSTTEEVYDTVSESGSTTESTSDNTETTESSKTESSETLETDKTESTETTSSGETTVSESTESTVTKETSETEPSEATESTVIDASSSRTTESTGSTDSSTSSDSSSSTESTSDNTGTTESTKTESTETVETESTVTSSEPTETTSSAETTESGSTESTVTEELSTTGSSEATESTAVEASTTSSEPSGTTAASESTVTESSTTEEIDDTVTDSSSTTVSSSDETTGTSVEPETTKSDTSTSVEASTTESAVSTSISPDSLVTGKSTDLTTASEEDISTSESTDSTTSEKSAGTELTTAEVTSSSTEASGSTTEPVADVEVTSTKSEETTTFETTEATSTIGSSESESTTSPTFTETVTTSSETSESSTLLSSTESELLSTTEAEGTTESTITSSTEESSELSTQTSESSTQTSESSTETSDTTTGSEESTTEEVSTTLSVSTESSSTTIEEAETVSEDTTETGSLATKSEYATTESSEGTTTEVPAIQVTTTAKSTTGKSIRDWKTTVGIPHKRKCKKRQPKCGETMFGCCPDRRTPAKGPYDEGCPRPKTCHESEFGCCPDDLSPALGPLNEGCPPSQCAETLFGCCLSDNKTAAEGNDQEGCPPPPPACKSSTHGCCADGETEAKGPEKEGCPEITSTEPASSTETESQTPSEAETSTTDVFTTPTPFEDCSTSEFGCCYDNETAATAAGEAGCPCNITEFGCCPDGVSTAKGVNLEGCPTSCSTSTFGCCSDGKTPAHGPNSEGCCLMSAFGCCPDNHKPAEGPHLEGCGCQYAQYGCCPDNATIAKGPNYQGCGCQYAANGCCPDRHTEASGPNFEGCACHTYQFGCCPDGVTIAKGPDGQGCDCHLSQFGCCGDGKTPASGPNKGGCDCASSEFGCCPDGQTEAKGHKFFGCSDIPVNRQAACSQPTDRGSCRNFAVFWYYDLEYGGCSRFWYGGCDGNGNRFATKEECEDVCVQPAPKDACNLPKVKGACMGYYVRWYYDSEREQCSQFVFGGCLGNANNFESRELCQSQCQPTRTEDQCTLPIERGSCAGNFARWGFNSETRRCEQFIWGGCEGNTNRFSSEAACIQRCDPPGVPKQPDVCALPAERGDCADYREKWYYDTAQKMCRQFYYGGCGGNENNFASQMECERRCSDVQVSTTVLPPEAPSSENICFREVDPGPCTNMETRWTYDYRVGRCIEFEYGGCGGNQNNFPTEQHCQYYCHDVQDICQLPMMAGPCDGSLMRWFYDPTSDSCSQFTYGGCEGNDNRFDNRDDCERRCKTGPAHEVSTSTRAPTSTIVVDSRVAETLPPECTISSTLEPCVRTGQVWYLDKTHGECVSHDNLDSGESCRNTGVFPTQEACERSCGAFRNINVCRHTVDPGPCQNFVSKYYFDSKTERCLEFAYGGCHGGPNRFSTFDECQQICRPEIDPCKRNPEPGNCLARYTLWYYDGSRDECLRFIYGGCGGNDNRFETKEDCEGRCRKSPVAAMPSTTTTTLAPTTLPITSTTIGQPVAEECRTPESLEPCGSNVTMFYYDQASSSCLASQIGACRYANSYRTEEECERRCGAFKYIDVCKERLDPGPCRASIPKIYWDLASGSCLKYAYGGCGGSANRFSSVDECEEVCGSTGPGANEVLPPDCSGYDDECLQLVCPYGMARNTTAEGCTRCSCVNKIEDCTALNVECEALRCPYGIERTRETDGCEKCKCYEDPCLRNSCARDESCVPISQIDPITKETRYSASCRPAYETNEVLPNCDRYNEECARLRCDYAVQRTRAPDGCERCSCVQVEVDCEPLRLQCDSLKCNYGIEKYVGVDGCERCLCTAPPCDTKECEPGEKCVTTPYTDPITYETKYTAECRTMNKTGSCPRESTTEGACRRECEDDADCRGVGKCCARGCSLVCLVPDPATDPTPALYTTTHAPNLPQAPQVNHETEPEVVAAEGGKATLRCLFHGNPPPKITWRRGEITIEGDVDRYRLLSDGALEIVSLYRNDSGVYICVAENSLGTARQEITLQVNDPVNTPAGIAGEQNTVLIGELGKRFVINCLTYGYPEPSVSWHRGRIGSMVPYSSTLYEARGNVLLIRRLTYETVGQYACEAYNGIGRPSSWAFVVKAHQIDDTPTDNPYILPRIRGPNEVDVRFIAATTRANLVAMTTTTSTTPEPEIEFDKPMFTVPVATRISAPYTSLTAGSELSLTCEVDGYPEPETYWARDGKRILPSDNVRITGTSLSRLMVSRVSLEDAGTYECHAQNAYSSHYSYVQITVQPLSIPAKCTDNPFFANCHLIVRSKFCQHKYYSKFCCKSCLEAGQLSTQEVEMQADQPLTKKK